MLERSTSHSWGTVLEARDPLSLARFYSRLLGWQIAKEEPGWVTLQPPDGGAAYLGFQGSPDHVPPVWPDAEGQQQMQLHLDIEVDDLEAAVAEALAEGATQAAFQPQDDVRVMLDPAGHPFCLYVGD